MINEKTHFAGGWSEPAIIEALGNRLNPANWFIPDENGNYKATSQEVLNQIIVSMVKSETEHRNKIYKK